jgi:Protein of unknown function (DUF4019)
MVNRMFKNVIFSVFLLAFNLNLSAHPDSINAARDASTEWLKLVDGAQYQESWSEASSILRTAVSQTEWEKNLENIRDPLGAFERRDPDTSEFHEALEDLPDGEYFIFGFKSAFKNDSFTYEIVAVAKEPDSSWRVMGYYFD